MKFTDLVREGFELVTVSTKHTLERRSNQLSYELKLGRPVPRVGYKLALAILIHFISSLINTGNRILHEDSLSSRFK